MKLSGQTDVASSNQRNEVLTQAAAIAIGCEVPPDRWISQSRRANVTRSWMKAELHGNVLQLVLDDAHVVRTHAEQLFLRA